MTSYPFFIQVLERGGAGEETTFGVRACAMTASSRQANSRRESRRRTRLGSESSGDTILRIDAMHGVAVIPYRNNGKDFLSVFLFS